MGPWQEDFPRTPSPVYHLSRSSSRAANDESEAANAVLDLQLAHLRESASASGDSSAVGGGMGSRSTTPIPGVSNLHQSSGPVAPVPRIPTPEISLSSNVRSASPSLARMSGGPPGRGFVHMACDADSVGGGCNGRA